LKYVLTSLAAAGIASTASAQVASFSTNLGDLLIEGQTPISIDTSAVSGDFVAFRVTTDWSVAAGNPWSSEALVAFGDPSTLTFISDAASGVNADFTGDPVTGLTFVGGFDVNPASLPTVDFVPDSGTFGDANFDNTVVEWFQLSDLPTTTVTVPGPASPNAPTNFIDLGIVGAIGDPLVFDTFGSLNNFGTEADTELGLYAISGELLAQNDDAGGGLTSSVALEAEQTNILIDDLGNISIENLSAGPGDYFLVVDEFDTLFGDDFDVTPGLEADEFLDITLNLNGELLSSFQVTDAGPVFLKFTVVPEPTLGLAAFAALPVLMRRRRA
jgi:hypothetical protein